jgi:hypothetical protein
VGLREKLYLWICPVATVIAAGLILYAVYIRSLTPLHGAYLVLLFAIFALMFTLFLFSSLWEDDEIRVESNWGGLGGGLSGWSMSTPLVYLLIALGTLALLVMAISSEKPQADLRERYRSAVNLGVQKGIQFETPVIAGGKLLLKGTAPSQAVVNQFWDQLKLANPIPDDVTVDLSVKPPASTTGPASVTPAPGPSSSTPASGASSDTHPAGSGSGAHPAGPGVSGTPPGSVK